MKSDDARILTSWKEIAGHLDVTVRTAQLWEKQRGLPVRRMPGPRSRVYLRLDEYEAWLTGQEAGPSNAENKVFGSVSAVPARVAEPENVAAVARSVPVYRRLRGRPLVQVALGLIAGILLTVLLFPAFSQGAPGPPTRGYVSGDTLIIEDAHGVELWRRRFDGGLRADAYVDDNGSPEMRHRLQFADVDGDGTVEVLFAQRHAERALSDVLFCFSAAGEVQWRFVPGMDVAYDGETFPNVFHLAAVVIDVLEDGRTVVLTSGIHYMDEPTQIAVVSPRDGALLSQYWHSGHIGHQANGLKLADLDGDGRKEILAGGINNARQQATVVVLDPLTMTGASEEPAAYQLVGFETGSEIARIFLPRSTMNRVNHRYNCAAGVFPNGDSLQISVEERFTDASNPTVVYELTAGLVLEDVGASDVFHVVHRQLASENAAITTSVAEELAMLRAEGIEVVWPRRRAVN